MNEWRALATVLAFTTSFIFFVLFLTFWIVISITAYFTNYSDLPIALICLAGLLFSGYATDKLWDTIYKF